MRPGVLAQPRLDHGHALADQRIEVEDDDPLVLLGQPQQPRVGFPPHRPEPRPRPVIDELRGEPPRKRQGVEDERPARGLREPRDQPRQRPDPLPRHPLHVLGPPGHRNLVEDHHRVEHTEGQIGPAQLTTRVGEVEDVRVEVREVRPQQQPVAGQFDGQGRQQRCQRAVPGDGDAHDRHGRMLRHHLVRIEPRQQLPGPGEFGVRGTVEQTPNAGILTNEPSLAMQLDQRGRPALHQTLGAGCACHSSPRAQRPVRGAGRRHLRLRRGARATTTDPHLNDRRTPTQMTDRPAPKKPAAATSSTGRLKPLLYRGGGMCSCGPIRARRGASPVHGGGEGDDG